MIKIPQENIFNQPNLSDRFGNTYQTKNISFDNRGYMKLSQKMGLLTDSTTLTNLQQSMFKRYLTCIAYQRNLARYWIGSNRNLYWSTSGTDVENFTQDPATDSPSLNSTEGGDLLRWNDKIYACNNSEVVEFDGTDTWTSFATVAGRQLASFDSLNRLAVQGVNNIWLVDTGGAVTMTLEIPNWFSIQSMAYNNQRLFIATTNKDGGDAQIFEWDGLSPEVPVWHNVPNATRIENIGAYKDGAIAVTNTGEILYVAGGVQTVGYLPIYHLGIWNREGTRSQTEFFVPPHGIKTVGEDVLISVNSSMLSRVDNTWQEEFPSGVYAWNPNFGVSLKYTISEDEYFGGVNNIPSIIFSESNFLGVDEDVANRLLIGGVIQKSDGTAQELAVLTAPQANKENRGYWVSPKIESQLIDDQYDILLKWTTLTNASDKIIVKYRQSDKKLRNYELSNTPQITWVNTTSFTTTEDISNVSVGDEVQFTAGGGAGYLAHITNISLTSGTYTVTIDETVTGITAGDRAKVIFNNWIKYQVIDKNSEDNEQGYRKMRIDSASKWIQIKVELRGIDTRIEDIIINNKNHKKSI
jgi:hypothetical protein